MLIRVVLDASPHSSHLSYCFPPEVYFTSQTDEEFGGIEREVEETTNWVDCQWPPQPLGPLRCGYRFSLSSVLTEEMAERQCTLLKKS